MTKAELHAFAEKHGVKVELASEYGPGQFRVIHIGIGETYQKLLDLKNQLQSIYPYPNEITITSVNNPTHEDYRKQMLEIQSFWYE